MIRNILIVALGGAVGSACRYLITKIADTSFPWATFSVNILGSLLIGLLIGWLNRGILSPEMKLLLVSGFCGGFTTFSTFANESFRMLKTGEIFLFFFFLGASVVIGVLAVWLGIKLSGG